jgi:hypothetical protein
VRVAAGRGAVAVPANRDAALVANPEGEGQPHRHRHHRRQVADHGDQVLLDQRHVDVSVAPARGPVLPGHVLRQDAPGLDTARDVHAHVTVQRSAGILGAHRRRHPDRGRLVAPPGIEGAGNLALLVEDVAALFDPARYQHVAIHSEEICPIQPELFGVERRAERLGIPGYRHLSSVVHVRERVPFEMRARSLDKPC